MIRYPSAPLSKASFTLLIIAKFVIGDRSTGARAVAQHEPDRAARTGRDRPFDRDPLVAQRREVRGGDVGRAIGAERARSNRLGATAATQRQRRPRAAVGLGCLGLEDVREPAGAAQR